MLKFRIEDEKREYFELRVDPEGMFKYAIELIRSALKAL